MAQTWHRGGAEVQIMHRQGADKAQRRRRGMDAGQGQICIQGLVSSLRRGWLGYTQRLVQDAFRGQCREHVEAVEQGTAPTPRCSLPCHPCTKQLGLVHSKQWCQMLFYAVGRLCGGLLVPKKPSVGPFVDLLTAKELPYRVPTKTILSPYLSFAAAATAAAALQGVQLRSVPCAILSLTIKEQWCGCRYVSSLEGSAGGSLVAFLGDECATLRMTDDLQVRNIWSRAWLLGMTAQQHWRLTRGLEGE
eukprot:scaffold4162_cov18-Tisochrysis_lutea.AAC.1